MEYVDNRTGDTVRVDSHSEAWVPNTQPHRVFHPSGEQAGATYYISDERLAAQFTAVEPLKIINDTLEPD